MVDVFRLCALPITAVAEFPDESEPLRPAGEAANKRGRTLVLPAPYLHSCTRHHDIPTLAYESRNCLFFLRKCFQALGETEEGKGDFFLGLSIAQDGGALERLFAPHNKEIGATSLFCETNLLGQGFNADILRERHMRLAEVIGELDREPLCFVADMDERETQPRWFRFDHHPTFAWYLEYRTDGAYEGAEREVAGKVVVARPPRNTTFAKDELKAGIAPAGAAADECACELIGRLGHFEIFEQVLEALAACVREMLGRRGKVFSSGGGRDQQFGGKKGVMLRGVDAFFGKRRAALFEKIRKPTRVPRASLFIAHRIDADDGLFVKKVARKRDERVDDDRVGKRAVRAERVELDDRFFWRRAAWRDIGMPDKERLAGTPCALEMLGLLQEARDNLGNQVERKMGERFGVARRLAYSAPAPFRGERRERHEAVILADRTRFV